MTQTDVVQEIYKTWQMKYAQLINSNNTIFLNQTLLVITE